MKTEYSRKRNIFSIPLRLGLVLIQIFMLVGVVIPVPSTANNSGTTGDVVITADLGKPVEGQSLEIVSFTRRGDFEVLDVDVSWSREGATWQELGTFPFRTLGGRAVLNLALPASLRFVRMEFHRARGAGRILLGSLRFYTPGPSAEISTHARFSASSRRILRVASMSLTGITTTSSSRLCGVSAWCGTLFGRSAGPHAGGAGRWLTSIRSYWPW